jgi:superfamily II DNA or RNA helicase
VRCERWFNKRFGLKCSIVYDDSACTVFNSFPELEQMLHYEHRSIDQEQAGRPITVETLCLFNTLTPGPNGERIIQTFQGLLDDILECCQRHGRATQVHDTRLKFPMPSLHLMHGFRFSQRDLLTKALLQNRSGLIGAPTRYGKSTLLINALRAFPNVRTVVTAPGVDLLKQLQADIVEKCPTRKVVGIYTGGQRIQGPDISVVSMDSLEKCDLLGTKLVLIDEPHAAVTGTRAPYLSRFASARKLGFGATLSGRFDQADVLIRAAIGPVLVNRTYKEAVAEGAIAPIEVAMLKIKLRPFNCGSRDHAYNALVFRNPEFHQLIAKLCREAVPPDWQTLVFIKNSNQAEAILKEIPEGTIAMAKLLTTKERAEVTARVKSGEIRRCIASDIYSQGVTFHDVRVMINAGGGGGSISCIQKPGRLAEIRPGKKCGVVIDVVWEIDYQDLSGIPQDDMLAMFPNPTQNEWRAVVRDSRSRIKVYEEKGYHVTYHEDVDSIKKFIQTLT